MKDNSHYLAIDIGNSRVKFGVLKGSELIGVWTDYLKSFNRAKDWIELIQSGLAGCECTNLNFVSSGLSCVVPSKLRSLTKALEHFHLEPIKVSAANYPFGVKYSTPETLGADRLAAAAGAFATHKGPLVVVDFGTALTINAVSAAGAFLGGAIMAGPELATVKLARKTSLLPQIEVNFPPRAIGMTTTDAIASGITYGLLELVDGMIWRFEKELGHKVWAVATGGAGEQFALKSRRIEHYDPYLSLKGIAVIIQNSRNRA